VKTGIIVGESACFQVLKPPYSLQSYLLMVVVNVWMGLCILNVSILKVPPLIETAAKPGWSVRNKVSF